MSQPFDNRDYDVQKLAKKDAEIERLKETNLSYSSTVGVQEREITRLQKLIGELADALEGTGHRMPASPCIICDLIERARKAVK